MRESASKTDIAAVVFIVMVTFFFLAWVLDGIELHLDAWEQASDEVYDPESRSDEREEGEGK